MDCTRSAAGAHGVADIDAAADARVGILERLQNIERRGPQLILRTVIVDGDADVIFLDELLDAG